MVLDFLHKHVNQLLILQFIDNHFELHSLYSVKWKVDVMA
jgi:hypothetical protein